MSSNINIKNRKASFEYQFIATFVAGISLVGTEIKSIRNNKANISDAHCVFMDEDILLSIQMEAMPIMNQKETVSYY
jgi:SsrA-binding protein